MTDFSLLTVTLNPTFDTTCSLDGLEPGRVNRVISSRTDPGGKGINLSRVFTSFGGNSTAFVMAGEENASLLEKMLLREQVPYAFFPVPGAVRENMTYLLPDGKEVKVNRPGPYIPKQLISGFSQWLEEQMGAKSVAAFAGSLPPGFSPEDFVALAQRCAKKCPIVLDTSSLSLPQLLSCGPWVIKPNLEELEALAKTRLETLAQQTRAGRALLEKGIRYVLISLGGQGLLGLYQEQAWLVKVPKVPVLSTVGAGDSALAGFLLALSKGKAFPDALRSAAAFGTAAVATEGTNPPSRQKVEEIYGQTQLCRV